jgi:hypothetical protein
MRFTATSIRLALIAPTASSISRVYGGTTAGGGFGDRYDGSGAGIAGSGPLSAAVFTAGAGAIARGGGGSGDGCAGTCGTRGDGGAT